MRDSARMGAARLGDAEPAARLVAEVPWARPGGRRAATTVGGRPCLLTDGEVEEVTADATHDALPVLGEWTDEAGHRWRCFELPDTSLSGGTGPCSESVQLTMQERGGLRTTGRIEIAGSLPRSAEPVLVPDASEDPGADRDDPSVLPDKSAPGGNAWLTASEKAEELIGRHIDLVNGLYDEATPGSHPWEGEVQGMAIRPAHRVIARWLELGGLEEPRSALIVRLARELPDLLIDLCQRPRHVLGRVRQMQPVGRVQEVDATCLRWLARQPGRHVAEKAGVSQRVMGIARVEDIDTLENRVLRDLLRRSSLACRRYQIEYGRFDHDRVRSVARFGGLVRRMARHPSMASVRSLVGVPHPNYVLQRDPRYQTAWSAFLQLVRQEAMRDNAWRWRHRIWAEDVGLALLATLRDLAMPGIAEWSDLLLHAEQVAGRFFDPRAAGPGWMLNGKFRGSIVDLLDGRPESGHLLDHPFVPPGLASLRPDHVAVRRKSEPDRPICTAGVWTVLDFDLDVDRLGERVTSLAGALQPLTEEFLVRALLIQPTFDRSDEDRSPIGDFIEVGPCRGVRLPLPLQTQVGKLQGHLTWALRL